MTSANKTQPIVHATRGLYVAMGRFDRVAASRLGLHVTDLHCLDLLESGPCSASQLAEGLGLTRSAVTTILDRLESAGFIKRRPSKRDRRRLQVALTRDGRRKAARVFRQLGNAISERTGAQSEPERERTAAALEALAEACEEATSRLRPAR